ncbi:myelin-associated oligodendrocyte basic protein [Dasypus novemcinctus]|uniref:myelin-associated oligodendrocyte basic protein n=1 Tax=Dasypus novemcinctus TaxID=9361 RepID=UPI00265E3311|nr:myelin-associated oligodendrocyte basic protein [Dasypus novemcinctus]XP_058144222.1 myelin-associated oligodendrocyte basic protein [Dasypus novemcinctus]XP_058144223.1 myelin-associated oligodendrocyte basic protein [Dasypus novemcinctus]XP_058144224.1 myelin-associated oligodendrocyte basic protein [Dasypus novemcinctus]
MSQKAVKEGPRLSKNQRFSEHFSIRCCPPFTFLNSKRELVDRKYSLCRSGCFYQRQEEDWVCCACQKTRTSRRAASPPRPRLQPAAPPAAARAAAKPRSPPRSERQPRPRPEARPPPAKPRAPPKPKPKPRSPLRGAGAGRGAPPARALRFW